ncbi:MAG: rRNA maturation RNase YbeY [Pseudomonadota bacterium]
MNRNAGMTELAILDLEVIAETPAWAKRLPEFAELCRGAAGAAFAAASGHRQVPGGAAEATLLLADDARIRALNKTFRGRDEPTNVLSFPNVEVDVLAAAGADGPPCALGDIVIAFETTVGEAAREGTSLSHHLSHLVVHGILHLLGYDHSTDDEALVMEALEVRALAALGIADPYSSVSETPR